MRSLARLGPRLALSLAAALAALAAAEVGLRARLVLADRPHDPAELRARLERALEPLEAPLEGLSAGAGAPEFLLHPYLGWTTPEREEALDAALAQLREPAPGSFTLCLLGGANAEALGASSGLRHAANAGAGPEAHAALVAALAADPRLAGREIRVWNAASAGHKAPQQLHCLAWLLALGLRFDAIACLDGQGELQGAWENTEAGVHALYPLASRWVALVSGVKGDPPTLLLARDLLATRDAARSAVERGLGWGLDRSALGGLALSVRAHRLSAEWNELHAAYRGRLDRMGMLPAQRGPASDLEPQAALVRAVRGWAECSRGLQAIAGARGLAYAHVLEPCVFDAGSKPVGEEERAALGPAPEWIGTARRGYPLLRTAGLGLKEGGLSFTDASQVFQGNERPLYGESGRLGPEGLGRLAEELARALLACLPPEAPAASGEAPR